MHTRFVGLKSVIVAAAIGAVGLFVLPHSVHAQAPSGSYRGSCNSAVMGKGGYLEASCRKKNGRWQKSRVKISQCKGRDIVNNNGRLVCGPANSRRGNANNHRWDNNGKGRDDRGRYDGHDRKNRNTRKGVIIYDGSRWSGRSMSIRDSYVNLARTGFNDVASSIRIVGGGTWQLCSDKNYGGRCVNVRSDVRDLNTLLMNNRISSLRRIR